MDSLYGGRPGAPFVIKEAFDSIDLMVEAFRQGPDYKDVWYGEYCIIDTPNKNSVDNGKIYQRGADFSAEDGNAIYIGQIVGPQSGTPYYNIKTISAIKDIIKQPLDRSVFEERAYPYIENGQEKVWIDDSNSNTDKDLAILSFGHIPVGGNDPALVSGKTQDDIKYTWCNVSRAHEDGYPTWMYVGFQIPYPVVEFTATSISPYDSSGTYNPKPTVAENAKTKDHPFWYEYNIGIPKGVKGDTFRSLRVITLTSAHKNNIYNFEDFKVNSDGTVSVGSPSYVVSDEAISNKRQVYVVDFLFYDKKQNPTAYTIYIGPYNQVKDVALSADGVLTFYFTYDNAKSMSQRIKWINSISLTSKGRFTVDYNYGTDYATTISWVDNIVIDDETGQIKIHWCDKGDDEYTVLDSKMTLITSAAISNDGVITFGTNTKESITLNQSGTQDPFHLRYVKSLELTDDTDLKGDKRLHVVWNGTKQSEYIGDSINYIVDMYVRQSDWHLLVLFNDPTHRISLEDANSAGIGSSNEVVVNGNKWVRKVRRIDGIVTAQNENEIFWRDYGTIKDQSGVLIGGNVDSDDISASGPSMEDIIEYLNGLYPNGYTDGKIITVGKEGDESKAFYAFDYNTNTWYYLGEVSDVYNRSAALIFPPYDSSDYKDILGNGIVVKASSEEYVAGGPTKFWRY